MNVSFQRTIPCLQGMAQTPLIPLNIIFLNFPLNLPLWLFYAIFKLSFKLFYKLFCKLSC